VAEWILILVASFASIVLVGALHALVDSCNRIVHHLARIHDTLLEDLHGPRR
jgi:hypothetical protein